MADVEAPKAVSEALKAELASVLGYGGRRAHSASCGSAESWCLQKSRSLCPAP